MHGIRKMVPTALQMKARHINNRFSAGILFVSLIAGAFWACTQPAGVDKCDFEGTSIRVYVRWDGSYRALRWNAEGLKKIKNAPRPDDPESRTNVARPRGDKRALDLPQELFSPDRRLNVPFALSRDGRMVVSAVHDRDDFLSPSQEFAVIDLKAKRLVHLVKTDYYIASVTWSPTGKYFAVLFRENVTKQLWKGPLDLLGGLLGHPRLYYTLHVVIYTPDGKVACKRTIMEKLLAGRGYIDWECFQASARWQASDIVGYRLELIDKQVYQSFGFTAQGDVFAGVNVVKGLRTAPIWRLWRWEIDNEGVLNIKDGDGSILYEMRKLYERKGRVGVECSGINREYEKQKSP
jgi:hypothetical protein